MALERFEILADLSAAMTANDNLSKIMFDIDFREMWINAQILLGNGPSSVLNGLTALEQRMGQAQQTKVILATRILELLRSYDATKCCLIARAFLRQDGRNGRPTLIRRSEVKG
ncbi:hypothetical protein [Alloacidobacterium sp.]|uniref:hypothetical protein n=1 Tax=Alloacidobacterium sp. TaxID=2951999 RepID=UPI002D23758D|nr:hypothetical protein [Alloacidobacterium sp.]HYK36059.1 hypothetical protein [Alloacidobacterium sp.]